MTGLKKASAEARAASSRSTPTSSGTHPAASNELLPAGRKRASRSVSSTTSSGESSVDSQSTRCFRSTGVSHNRSGRRENPDLIDEASISYLELAYPPKWISRAGARLSIGPGNHTIDGLDGPTASIEQIRCLHVPLRARAVLDWKARHWERLAEAGYPLQHGWHVRRIAHLAAEGRLDEEWELNSHLAGVLTARDGRNVRLERDPTLRGSPRRCSLTATGRRDPMGHECPLSWPEA